MRLSGRIAAAMEIIDNMAVRHRPVSLALRDWGQANRFAGSKDRAAIGNLVYDVVRRRASHAHAMQSDSGRALVLSVMVRDWGQSVEQLNAAFAEDKFAPDTISASEQKLLNKKKPLAGASDHIKANLPEWLVPAFKKSFGKNWVEQSEALSLRPPLDMRVNTLKSDTKKVQKSLERFSPALTVIAASGLRIAPSVRDERTPNVQVNEAFLKGGMEIQDEGSQIVSALCAPMPGAQVLDYCAGAGGKTLALAALMQNKGQLFAHDTDRNRLAPIFDRLKRAGVRNVQVRGPQPGSMDNLVAKMDKVVVDAPCTGTGTWRRHPGAKWRLSETQLQKRVGEQAEILDKAGEFVVPGGELVYITCSLLPEENHQQVEAFIKRSRIFFPIDIEARWNEVFPKAKQKPLFDGLGATLSPLTTGTDGFYISLLKKKDKSTP
ncbi:MAG TPA: RsmB/NOP family class I SAM-dependent RNA methyltransferase [Devosia sp.]|nr:RsmB/NOP family class I SAM-dependent RNA methyltransferase [Devosia sp.]